MASSITNKKKKKYREGWILVNKVQTHVITWGCWIEDLKEGEEVIFTLAGNPGITEFYIDFLDRIHENLNIPVWIVSHAGFEIPPSDAEGSSQDYENEPYDLDTQIAHKAYIFEKYIPKGCKVYTICHSLGSYINLELMKGSEDIAEKIQKSYMLFPMIMNMADTPNGKNVQRATGFYVGFALMFFKMLQLLPVSLQYYVCYASLFITRGVWDPDEHLVRGMLQFIKPTIFRNMYQLAIDEMKRIREPDVNTISKFCKKLKFYYGATDGWCPLKNYEYICNQVPKVDAVVCRKGISHAFILKSAHIMADYVCDWFQTEFRRKPEGTTQHTELC